MQYTLILKPSEKTRRKITRIKKRLETKYGYTGSLSSKGVHITMAYLKNPWVIDISSIERLCIGTLPFTFTIGGPDYFEKIKNGIKSYIVYYRVIPSREMEEFHEKLVKSLGNNSMDAGKFVPHITLIRKNVDDKKLDEILSWTKNIKIDCQFMSNYLIVGKRLSQNGRWNFDHIYFRKI
jgi:2'-5' RNA ligase